jgi:hypothetical protein
VTSILKTDSLRIRDNKTFWIQFFTIGASLLNTHAHIVPAILNMALETSHYFLNEKKNKKIKNYIDAIKF